MNEWGPIFIPQWDFLGADADGYKIGDDQARAVYSTVCADCWSKHNHPWHRRVNEG